MKRFLLMAGLALPTLPACVHANDFHRVLTETHAELRQTEMLSGPVRSGASSALLERLDALEHATRNDPVLLEKAQRLNALARFQLVHGGRIAALDLPTAVPTYRQPGAVGESCESPLPLNTGEAIELQMQPLESVWFRVQGTLEKAIGVSTRGSSLDTHLSAWPDCRELVAEPFAAADDSIGLQAELTLPTDNQTFWLVRLDNLSDQAGIATLGGINVSQVQGTVVRSADGTPVSQATVGMFRVIQGGYQFHGAAQVDAQGRYLLGYQNNGAYVLRTGSGSHFDRLAHEAWLDVPCVGNHAYDVYHCAHGQNQPTQIVLDGGSATVNFSLDRLGEVTGTVRDAATGTPLPNALVQMEVLVPFAPTISTSTDALGRYRVGLVNAADSYLFAQANNYHTQLYNGVDCLFQMCDFAAGTPLRNDLATPLIRADFALSQMPQLGVKVRVGDSQAASSSYFSLTVFDASGIEVRQHFFYGPDTSISNLVPGDYRIRIESSRTYSQLYSSVECMSTCFDELDQGTVVNIPASGASPRIEFNLRARPVLRGTVLDAVSGEPVTHAQVTLFRSSGSYFGSSYTNAGRFEIQGIPVGSYLLLIESPSHTRQLFENVPCLLHISILSCPGATLLVFTRESGDREVDISLQPNPIIAGRMSFEGPNQPTSIELRSLSATSQPIRSVWVEVDSQGSYRTQEIQPDNVRLGATNSSFWDQVFPQLDCISALTGQFAGCDLAAATVLSLESGGTYEGVNFRLRPRDARAIRLLRASDNTPLAGVGIDIWNTNGVRLGSLRSSTEGMIYISNNSFETRLISTFNLLGLEDQVYNGIRCPDGPVYFGQCSLEGATPIPSSVNGSTMPPEIVIRLSDGMILFNHGFED